MTQTAQQIDPNSTLGQGVPTQTPDSVAAVPNTVMPNQIPAQPAAPSAQPATTAQPNQPARPAQPAQSARPAQPAQPPTPRGLHSAIFDGVLKTLGGGTQYINQTDPTTGETKQVPIQQTRGQLGKNILAGAIAGMFGGMGARDKEGRHDPGLAAEQGFVAGQKPMQQKVAQLQKTADEDISRRQMVMKNNMDLVHQQVAMTHLLHEELATTADNNNKGILADAAEFDNNLSGADVNDMTKKAIQGRKMTHQQALDKLQGHWSDTMAMVDGWQDIRNPQTGQMEVEPTYAVLNPNVSIKMSEAQAAQLATFKPAYKNAYEDSGGNLRIPLQRYVADVHQLNSLNQMQAFLANAQEQLGIKNMPNLAAVAAKGGQPVLSAVQDMENAIGQGGAKGGDPTAALQRLAGTGGGAQILRAMGISNDQVQELVNKKIKSEALAKEGGMGPKSSADDATVDGLLKSLDQSNIPDEVKDTVRGGAKKDTDGHYNMNVQEKDDLRNRILTAQSQANQLDERMKLANGDPVAMANTAHDVIGFGSTDSITHLASMRGNARQNGQHAIEQQAANLGLNPLHFDQPHMDAKAESVKSYSSAGKIGAQLNSFQTFGEHVSGAREANEAWKRTGSPDLNQTMAWWAKHASNNQEYQAFRDSIIAPAKEYMSFLNQNRAEHEDDIRALQKVLSEDQTPQSMYTALQVFAKTADDRAWSLGDKYINTVGTTFPGIVSKQTVDSFASLGVKSRAAAVSGELPRAKSFADNYTFQTLAKGNPQDTAIAKRFFAAAGGDMERMKMIAKEHGYIIP